MSKPIQLIINDVRCPTTTRDRYHATPVDYKELLQMADRSWSEEVVGTSTRIVYSYDKMEDGTYQELLRVLRGGGVKTVSYLPDDGTTELVTSQFLVETSLRRMLYFGLCCLIRLHSSTSASNSLAATITLKSRTFATIAATLGIWSPWK